MGTDKNWTSYADIDGVYINNDIIQSPDSSYADTLKFSHVHNAVVAGTLIVGGYEDAVDVNRECQNITLLDCTLFSKGQYCMTIKGGSDEITLENVLVANHGTTTDIDIGNWSDQSVKPTTRVVLRNVTSHDGHPVKVRVLHADRPTVIGGNVKVTVYPRILVNIYRFLRKHGLAP